MNQHYVYIYFDPQTGMPIYVGKGINKRATCHFIKHKGRFGNTIRKRKAEGYSITPIIIPMPSEAEALQLEIFWIAYYGREDLCTGTLFNLTDGGEGVSNPSQLTRSKISKALTGIKRSESTKEKLRAANLGKKYSEEHNKRKCGRTPWNKGQSMTQETKDKIREATLERYRLKRKLLNVPQTV